jgi:integrase
MAILGKCPICHIKRSIKNKRCSCGENLSSAKRSQRLKYWINYRLPGGRQRREPVGFSLKEAKDAEGKRRSQKRENKIFDIKPDTKMTFKQLKEWYLGLEKIKSKKYFETLKINLNSFNKEFSETIVSHIKPTDLENYQIKRKNAGYSDSYIDHEIGAAQTMINKAFDNDLVGGEVLKAFKKVKKLLKRNSNVRDRILTLDEFNTLMENLPRHTRAILATGFYTGMRRNEILKLRWSQVDLKNRIIRLEAEDTKDNEPRVIPVCDELYEILKSIPKAIQDDHVFLYNGKPIKSIRRSLRRACKETGITYGRFTKDGFVFHDLRHCFNTYMRKAGVAESVIMKITGHSTREMFDRYNTVDKNDLKNVVDQWQLFLKNVDQNVDQEQKRVSR